MRFSDLYSRAQFETAAVLDWGRSGDWERSTISEDIEAYKVAQAADKAARDALNAHEDEVFKPAMLKWLESLRAQGRLNIITGLAGRSARTPNAWNAFVAGTAEDYQIDNLLNTLKSFLIWSVITVDQERHKRKKAEGHIKGTVTPPTQDMIDAAYAKLVNDVEQGNTDHSVRFDDIQDGKTGDRLKIELVGWHATLMRMTPDYHYEQAFDAEVIGLQSVEIDLPTGELLLSDWIRVPGFKQATDLGFDDASLNINCTQGAVNTTKAHATRHNFAHVQTTNTSVIVHQDETGRLMVSERWDKRDEEDATADGMKVVGDFSCDLWWATAIDKQVLLELMAQGGCEVPQETLQEYLTSSDAYADNIVQLNVKPGRYRLHFGPKFAKMANRDDLGIPEGPEPWFVLEPITD